MMNTQMNGRLSFHGTDGASRAAAFIFRSASSIIAFIGIIIIIDII